MIERGKIETGVVNMFQVNMGIKKGEKIVVVTDVPTCEEWMKKESTQLTEMVERSVLAKMVSEVAATSFPGCTVDFYVYPSVGKHGTEPGREVEDKLKEADVAIAITSYSLSHTNVRENATQSGTRIASMPMLLPEMFYPGGPMAVDYSKIHEECVKIAALVDMARDVTFSSPAGTDLKFSLEGRRGLIDDGILTKKGAFGNLPAGEVYTVPLEGTTNGKLVVEASWYGGLEENLTFIFKDGLVAGVIGGGKLGDEFKELLQCAKNEEPCLSRRNCAELGIGTNQNAKRPHNLLEAEKIRETVHIAIGDSSHMGGKVEADLHQDFVIPKPTLIFDGQIIIREGKIAI
jgi:leucyl aminopeptidase (aminopeptidase T)